MIFKSIVFPSDDIIELAPSSSSPPYYEDLRLDQIVRAITAGKEAYDLVPLFLTPLKDVAVIKYRHEIFEDLERPSVMGIVRSFAHGMRGVRANIEQSDKLRNLYQKKWWRLKAVSSYCQALLEAGREFSKQDLHSSGLQTFRTFLRGYVSSREFAALASDAANLLRDLRSLRYSLKIKGGSLTVSRDEGEQDYAGEIRDVFARFRQGAAKSYLVEFGEWAEMNHVEEAVVDRIARLHPDLFGRLDRFAEYAADFVNDSVRAFDREIQFFVSYLDMTETLRRKGLRFCYPELATEDKNIRSNGGFDLALALKLAEEGRTTVTNDFYLEGQERFFVVSGPNQGGKTTFARTFGQLHYLAALGCPVPGKQARLYLFDEILTHFEREEDIANLKGKLYDDLVRMKEILERSTGNSIVILNEIFSSTTLSDEVFLSRQIIRRIIELGCLGVCVTFIDELSSLSDGTVSMMSTVAPDNPAERTFRVVRKPADGLAYAMAIAEKHGVTYAALTKRIES